MASAGWCSVCLPAAWAETAAPVQGFWKILTKPKAVWVLEATSAKTARRPRVQVETYDVRQVEGAAVARLRWTYAPAVGATEDIGDSHTGRYTQVAVTVTESSLQWVPGRDILLMDGFQLVRPGASMIELPGTVVF